MKHLVSKNRWIALGIVAVFFCGCTGAGIEEPDPISFVDLVESGESNLWRVDFDQYRSPDPDLPIGVFDSGIGGLTVLNEIVTIDRFGASAPGSRLMREFGFSVDNVVAVARDALR